MIKQRKSVGGTPKKAGSSGVVGSPAAAAPKSPKAVPATTSTPTTPKTKSPAPKEVKKSPAVGLESSKSGKSKSKADQSSPAPAAITNKFGKINDEQVRVLQWIAELSWGRRRSGSFLIEFCDITFSFRRAFPASSPM
jgi:hypothetical protein